MDGGAPSHRHSWSKKAKIFPHQNFCLFAKEQVRWIWAEYDYMIVGIINNENMNIYVDRLCGKW